MRVTIRSAVLPPVTLDSRDAASGGGPAEGAAGFLLRLFRPAVTVEAGGVALTRWAPAGEPPAVPWVGLGVGAIAALGVLLALAALGRR